MAPAETMSIIEYAQLIASVGLADGEICPAYMPGHYCSSIPRSALQAEQPFVDSCSECVVDERHQHEITFADCCSNGIYIDTHDL